MIRRILLCSLVYLVPNSACNLALGQDKDFVRQLQTDAIQAGRASWGHWGTDPNSYYNWCEHSNRLVPVYTFGIGLDSVRGEKSVYRREAALNQLYGHVPSGTLNPKADYFDQTDIYRLQMSAVESGKRKIILIIFDGMDWQTTRATAIYQAGRVNYHQGRGSGLHFQDYRGVRTDFGFFVTSPITDGAELDANRQTVAKGAQTGSGGYDPFLGGDSPWCTPQDSGYLLGWNPDRYHAVTDSANAATAMVTGIKSYNGAVNLDLSGNKLETVAHSVQKRFGFAIGVVTNMPISHATPAAAYAHNVNRLDYQDLSRDLLGIPSISHPTEPLPGVDVLLGAGWHENAKQDVEQGTNYLTGNQYLADEDRKAIDVRNGGKYWIAQRKAGAKGSELLAQATDQAIKHHQRLLGIFGVKPGHLPYRTADGDFKPVAGVSPAEAYTPADITENPTLADMTRSALDVLSVNRNGFWLMIEAGDVDWASHDVNIDNVIGSIVSGDEAFRTVTQWLEQNQAWQDAAVIVTSDHGHGFVLTDPNVLIEASQNAR